MLPRSIGTRRALLGARFLSRSPRRPTPSTSCSFATNSPPPRTPETKSPAAGTPEAARRDLSAALHDLEKLPESFTNPARVQLARHNLSQPAGHESIRLAVLAHRHGASTSSALAKKLLRLSLADPLQGEQPWEAQLEAHDLAQRPLLVRVVPAGLQESKKVPGTIETPTTHVIPELRVPSPVVRGAELEVLLMEDPEQPRFSVSRTTPEERLLTPEVTIAAVPEETPTPVPSPVHMALQVGEGEAAMRSILATPTPASAGDTAACAFQWGDKNLSDLTSTKMLGVDVSAAQDGLDAFRVSVSNALTYEAAWTKSNIGRINEWLRDNVQPNETGVTKPPVRHLIQSVLDRSRLALTEAQVEASRKPTPADRVVSPGAAARLTKALTGWSEAAHEELRHIVEDAFAHGPWHRLAWWKLLWRADDVGMVASEVLGKQFLLEAEKGVIFLSGRIDEAATTTHGEAPASASTSVEVHARVVFPRHIGDARRFLTERAGDLQTAAQRLVMWTAGQAGVTASLGGLVYLSGYGVYEAGSVAALGVVWGLTNLQRGWERARARWEDEVRVRGRQALQLTEQSVMTTLVRATAGREGKGVGGERAARLEKARGVVERAEEAFKRLK
ncbi:hypothetical protein B0T18DRAFT_319999 [Schizothecium vesticola]|uniref:Mmc1 C-terminal domain-containing protein n=1 Tax=Schizothecium vesticola TaxID=314040 RepID=A0AA40F6T2_9PEZI|nr:hypothetical protein B0T18DRAFT_319999 [Schizothecium vesticola]